MLIWIRSWDWAAAWTMAGLGLAICSGAPQPQLLPALAICAGLYLGISLLLAPAARLGFRALQAIAAWSGTLLGDRSTTQTRIPASSIRSHMTRAREQLLTSLKGLAHICISPVLLPIPK